MEKTKVQNNSFSFAQKQRLEEIYRINESSSVDYIFTNEINILKLN